MEKNNFSRASELWGKANNIAIDEEYYIQQQALCRYKSKDPSELMALADAWSIIKKLNPEESCNPETLGISGAICKRLYLLNDDKASLEQAIEYYKKGFNIYANYYTGENYANCLDMKAQRATDSNEKIANEYIAKEVRLKIIKDLEKIPSDELNTRLDKKWVYATLSNCFYYLGNNENATNYEKLFLAENPEDWEIGTFRDTKVQFKNK